jgi:hypothetical protein
LFHKLAPIGIPLPGAVQLLTFLRKSKTPHGIATSGKHAEIKSALKALSLRPATIIVDGNMVAEVKPEPDLFLLCQQKLKVKPADCLVVGDAQVRCGCIETQKPSMRAWMSWGLTSGTAMVLRPAPRLIEHAGSPGDRAPGRFSLR